MVKVYRATNPVVKGYLVVAPNGNHAIVPSRTTIDSLVSLCRVLCRDDEKFMVTKDGKPPFDHFSDTPTMEINHRVITRGTTK